MTANENTMRNKGPVTRPRYALLSRSVRCCVGFELLRNVRLAGYTEESKSTDLEHSASSVLPPIRVMFYSDSTVPLVPERLSITFALYAEATVRGTGTSVVMALSDYLGRANVSK